MMFPDQTSVKPSRGNMRRSSQRYGGFPLVGSFFQFVAHQNYGTIQQKQQNEPTYRGANLSEPTVCMIYTQTHRISPVLGRPAENLLFAPYQ